MTANDTLQHKTPASGLKLLQISTSVVGVMCVQHAGNKTVGLQYMYCNNIFAGLLDQSFPDSCISAASLEVHTSYQDQGHSLFHFGVHVQQRRLIYQYHSQDIELISWLWPTDDPDEQDV